MDGFFDNQFQFLKHFDVKAQGKPQTKKKWLLSRQYLQPLNEPDDEDSPQDDQEDSTTGYKKKLKCAYEAAKYGMKEGVLTGVFLGGCWGIFKHLGENLTLSFRSSGSVGDKQGGEKNASEVTAQGTPSASRRSSQKEPSLGSVTSKETSINPAPKGSDVYEEDLASYKKSMSVLREKTSDKNYYNTTTRNRLIYKFTNSKVPVRIEKQHPLLRAGGAGIYETNRFNFRRSREKVEIVGYAFIHTTGSIINENSCSDSIKSGGSESPKSNGSTPEKEDARKISSDDNSKTTMAGSSSGGKKETALEIGLSIRENGSRKNTRESVRSANHSEKNAGSSARSSRQSMKSAIGSSSEKLTKGIISSSRSTVAEEIQNSIPVSGDRSGNKTTDQIDSSYDYSINKQESKISGISSITYSNSSYQEVNKVVKNSPSVTAGNYTRGSMKETRPDADDRPDAENIFPDSKKTAGILVNADSLSNGFTSPDMYLGSAKRSSSRSPGERTGSQISAMSNQGRHSVISNISELGSKRLDHINSTSATSAIGGTDIEDQGRYKVESSPKFNGSYVSNPQSEEKYWAESNLTQERSYISRTEDWKYRVESSPTYNGSRIDVAHKEGSSPKFRWSSSEPQDDRRHSAEKSFTSSRSHVSETREGRSRSGSIPLSSRSHIGEAQDERSYRSYVSEILDEGVLRLERSPSYTKPYTSGTLHEDVARPKSKASSQGSYVSAAEIADRHSGNSRHSASFFRGRGQESVGGSAAHVKSQVSAVQNPEIYSSGKSTLEVMEKAESSAAVFREKSLSGGNEFTANSYRGQEREVSIGAVVAESGMADVGSRGGFASPPKRVATQKDGGGGGPAAVPKKEEAPSKSEKSSSRAFGFLSAVNENIIVLSACNCAIVLGVVCSVISTTRASLAV